MSRSFSLVDVFGTDDFSGNPLAVVADAEGLDGAAMQRIAAWLNLSETTFLLPPVAPAADYRIRIFTPARELPFAGHPTLGSCHAWLAAGGTPRIDGTVVQDCAAGLVTIRQGEGGLAFAAPPLVRSGPVDEAELNGIASILRIDRADIVAAAWTDNGPGWLTVLLASADAVLAVEPVRDPGRRIEIGLVGPHPAGGPAAYEVRALLTDAYGLLSEDPVTGSLNAAVAQWLFAEGRVSQGYVATQGGRLGRCGRIRIERDAVGQVWVEGRTTTLFTGRCVDMGSNGSALAESRRRRRAAEARQTRSMGWMMALELRPNCEMCDRDLPPSATDARICTFECTFCAACVEGVLANVCPNCGGGFAARPIRPATEWREGLSVAKRPPSARRHTLDHSLDEVAAFSERLRRIPPEER